MFSLHFSPKNIWSGLLHCCCVFEIEVFLVCWSLNFRIWELACPCPPYKNIKIKTLKESNGEWYSQLDFFNNKKKICMWRTHSLLSLRRDWGSFTTHLKLLRVNRSFKHMKMAHRTYRTSWEIYNIVHGVLLDDGVECLLSADYVTNSPFMVIEPHCRSTHHYGVWWPMKMPVHRMVLPKGHYPFGSSSHNRPKKIPCWRAGGNIENPLCAHIITKFKHFIVKTRKILEHSNKVASFTFNKKYFFLFFLSLKHLLGLKISTSKIIFKK